MSPAKPQPPRKASQFDPLGSLPPSPPPTPAAACRPHSPSLRLASLALYVRFFPVTLSLFLSASLYLSLSLSLSLSLRPRGVEMAGEGGLCREWGERRKEQR